MESSCVFCRKEIPYGNIRCEECNEVWWNGHNAGEKMMKDKIKEIINTIKNLYRG